MLQLGLNKCLIGLVCFQLVLIVTGMLSEVNSSTLFMFNISCQSDPHYVVFRSAFSVQNFETV